MTKGFLYIWCLAWVGIVSLIIAFIKLKAAAHRKGLEIVARYEARRHHRDQARALNDNFASDIELVRQIQLMEEGRSAISDCGTDLSLDAEEVAKIWDSAAAEREGFKGGYGRGNQHMHGEWDAC